MVNPTQTLPVHGLLARAEVIDPPPDATEANSEMNEKEMLHLDPELWLKQGLIVNGLHLSEKVNLIQSMVRIGPPDYSTGICAVRIGRANPMLRSQTCDPCVYL